ncbi:MAG: ABC transporter permease [Bacillota bacterium]|nr:ABC transporter permease [Bacillota bacterium]
MSLVAEGFKKAFLMLVQGDPELWRVTLLTLRVSGTATLVSLAAGVPLGVLLGLARFRGRNVVVSAVNTGMGLPPVVVGVAVSLMLWRSGPAGAFGMMYTPGAMVVAQCIIALPQVVGLTMAGIMQLDPRLALQIMALGASRIQLYALLVREARLSILAAIMAGFGAVVSEVGASMMVGGNIGGQTRVLTTAIVLEVNKGNFDVAIALSVVLMLLAYSVTAVLTVLQQKGRHA